MVQINNINISFNKPTNFDWTVILYIAWISWKALWNKLDSLEKLFIDNGFWFCRFENYRDMKEFQSKSIEIFQNDINEVIDYLTKNNCSKILIIGKSFWWWQSLLLNNNKIIWMSLWAPAIWVWETSTIGSLKGKKLKDINSIFDIKIDNKLLNNITIPIQIIHWTEDEIISISNSEFISNLISYSLLKEIPWADHSYSNNRELLYRETLEFFKAVKNPIYQDESFWVIPIIKTKTWIKILEIQHIRWHRWLPKWHPEWNETPLDTALRELWEEVWIKEIDIIPNIRFSQSWRFIKDNQIYNKKVTYFPGFISENIELNLQEKEIKNYKIIPIEGLLEEKVPWGSKKMIIEIVEYFRDFKL